MSDQSEQTVQTSLRTIEGRLQTQPDQHLEFEAHKETIREILELREQKNALILGHNYMHPLIFQISEADQRGDSLGLSRYAAHSEHPLIVFNGVRFMAETAKLLNPDKTVLIADQQAGCSLADGFSAEQARAYRRQYPEAPVVTYINSYATVKAESDYCCTSANALKVVQAAADAFNSRRVIFLPDTLMAKNLQTELTDAGSKLELIYPGRDDKAATHCEVHEQFTVEQLCQIRQQFAMPRGDERSAVLVHWECPPGVLSEADFYGSTSQMAQYIRERPKLKRVYLATECEMAANLASEFPQVEFVRSCSFYCPHMRRITLDKLHASLLYEQHPVEVDPAVASPARQAIERMLTIR